MVYVGGDVFGIKMYSDGVLVIKAQSVLTDDGSINPAAGAGIIPGDVIITANGKYIDSSETLRTVIEQTNDGSITLKVKREDEYLSKIINVVKDTEGVSRLGLWVKDSAAGLGTISFYSEDGKAFAALGHGICEKDTGALLPLSEGEICKANVTSVTKSKNSKVGTLNGYFTDEHIGCAAYNREIGVFGKCSKDFNKKELLEIASPSEIEEGTAQILTTVGENIGKYNIEIQKIDKSDNSKNMIIKITDDTLLSKTGGIVQGMSGSPIVQSNKVVGVLTHVFTDDVSKGYAVFAKTMYDTVCEIK